MSTYRCAICEVASFEHPNDESNCPHDGHGRCALLSGAGWRSAWTRFYVESAIQRGPFLGKFQWLCPTCVAAHGGAKAFDRKPKR